MDIFSLLSYINKISLLAFFITIAVVGYQLFALKREKNKDQVPSIPDFKDKIRSNEAVNYTRLPNLLINKKPELANYSKLIFLIISLLTIMVVIFVVTLIRRNSSVGNPELISNKAKEQNKVNNKSSVPNQISPTEKTTSPPPPLTASPTVTLSPSFTPVPLLSPTAMPVTDPTTGPVTDPTTGAVSELSPSPTEIILAKVTSLTPTNSVDNGSSNQENNKPLVLPETGNVGKGLFIIGVAISAIFFSFWF